jgi:Bacterial Ig domain
MKRAVLVAIVGAFLLQLPHGGVPVSAQAGGDALKFFKNYFVTGDYVVAGVGLRGLGGQNGSPAGIATGTLTVNGVPTDAEIVAAFLYWQVVSSISLGPDSGAVNATFDGSLLSSADGPFSKVLSTAGTAPCWSSGGATGSSGGQHLTFTYRADVRRFLRVDPTTERLAVNGPHVVQLPDAGSNGNGVPVALGASLVVVYRDPRMPLKAVVLYDGSYTMNQTTDSMSQTIKGFYQAAGTAGKMTHIVGSGQANKSERLLLPGLAPVLNPFTAALGNSWDSPTYDVSIGAGSGTTATSVDHVGFSSFDCLTWGAIVFSTAVQDTDGDGLLDIWESSTTPIVDPNGQPLPNLRAMVGGADHTNVKDVFVQIDYMSNGAGTYGGVAKPAHNHLPDPTALKMVGDAFASKGISLHFDVGSNYQSNEAGAGPYIIPTSLARGGKAIDENVTLLGCPGPTCEFPDFPGTVGWKVGFKFYRDQLVSATPPPLDVAGNDPCDVPSATRGDSNYDGPGGACERRFDRNRMDMFRYVLGAHALGLAKSEYPCLDGSTPAVPVGALADGGCAVAPNPDFHIPRTSSGVGDFPGADLMMTLGGFSDFLGRPVGTPFMQGATLMHELGHTFDLGHSGVYWPGVPAEPNCKPNYLSSMNYLFQLRGLFNDIAPLGTPHLDYSNEVLGEIDEVLLTDGPLSGAPSYHTGWYAPKSIFTIGTAATKHCDGSPLTDLEAASLAAGHGMVRVDGPSSVTLTSDWTSRSIDWNPDPLGGAPQDINFDGFAASITDPPDSFGVVHALHVGSNDWVNLRLNQLATRRNVLGLSIDLGRDGLGRGDTLGRDGLGRDGLGRDGLGRDGLGRDGLGRDGLGRDGLGRDGLGRDGLGRDGLGIAGLGRDGLGLEEVDKTIASATGHAPPNTFAACQIGAGCTGPSSPFHRISTSWNATDVDPDLVVTYVVYRFKTADGIASATAVGSVPGPASIPTLAASYSLIDTQELPNGSFTYYVIANFSGAAPGPSSPSNPLITLNVINDAPVANGDSYSMDQGATLNTPAPGKPGVLNNDHDDDSPLTALPVAGTGPSHANAFTLNLDGSFTYTPAPAFVGTDYFTYKATDVDPNHNSTAIVSITVNAVNHAPVAVNDTRATNEDTFIDIDVVANDTDVDTANSALRVAAGSIASVAGGTAVLQVDGRTVRFTPSPNANSNTLAAFGFSYRANDGALDSVNTATVSITVTPVNDAPSFTKGANQTVNATAGAQSVAGWATAISKGPADESGQTVNFIVTNNNSALFSVQPAVSATGVLTYRPSSSASGVATVAVKIHDNGGTANFGVDTSAAQTFTITVTTPYGVINVLNLPPPSSTTFTPGSTISLKWKFAGPPDFDADDVLNSSNAQPQITLQGPYSCSAASPTGTVASFTYVAGNAAWLLPTAANGYTWQFTWVSPTGATAVGCYNVKIKSLLTGQTFDRGKIQLR